jgi:hypothetical protein
MERQPETILKSRRREERSSIANAVRRGIFINGVW